MITDRVIKEIYRKYNKPAKNAANLDIDRYIGILAPFHNIRTNGKEVIFEDQEEFSPFRRILLRSLNAILEFDRHVAFVFQNHILFLSKESDDMRIHMRPCERRENIFQKIFAR